jgi:HK97 gp10 family phage protein
MNLSVEGMDEVISQIMSISDDRIKRNEILKILRRQAKPILAAVKANTPVADKPIVGRNGKIYEPENLKKSMAIKTSPLKNYPNVLVGPRKGQKAARDGFYAFFIQKGVYGIPANDFIMEAAEPLLNSAEKTMSNELEKYIDKKIQQTGL